MDEPSLRKIMAQLGIPISQRSASGWLNGTCPLAPWTHEKGYDRKPSFGCLINDQGRSAYKCYTCKRKGRMSDLVRSLEHFRETKYPGLAITCDAADMAGAFGSDFENVGKMAMDFEEPEPVDENAIAGIYPAAYEVPAAARYLRGRGIGEATAETLGLVYDPDERRVLFPVRGRQRELFGFTGRSILREDQYLYRNYPKIRDYLGLPKRYLMLGADLWQPGKPAVVIEGLFGYANFIEQGAREICNPVCSMGSELTPQKANWLAMQDAPTYLFYDNDQGGDEGVFGHMDKETGEFNGDGAASRLCRKGVITFVPEWPSWQEDTVHNGVPKQAGQPKTDPDELKFEEIKFVIENCPPWSPST